MARKNTAVTVYIETCSLWCRKRDSYQLKVGASPEAYWQLQLYRIQPLEFPDVKHDVKQDLKQAIHTCTSRSWLALNKLHIKSTVVGRTGRRQALSVMMCL